MEIKSRIELHKLIDLRYPVAEIGCAEGLFSLEILQWGAKLIMVDNWGHIPGQRGDGGYEQSWHEKNYMEAMNRVLPYRDRVTVLQGKSVSCADAVEDESLSMVYLDADHSYEGVRADLKVWLPKIRKGGIIAGHDYLNPDYGVRQAVDEILTVTVIPENSHLDASFYAYRL
jgi:hypothetical protein